MLEIAIDDPYYQDKMNIVTALYNVMDPELFINIIDMGLVYDVDFIKDEKIIITMTFSTKACPLGDSIKMGVKNALAIAYPDYPIEIEVVWEPEWNFDMLSAEGRAQLGF